MHSGTARVRRLALLLVASALLLTSCEFRNKSGEVVMTRTDTAAAFARLAGGMIKNTVTAPFRDNSPPFRIRSPSFSPDSKFLVMDYLVPKKKRVLAIWDIENERLNKVPEAPKGRAWITPSFSPGGSQVIFADCDIKSRVCRVASIDRDGSNYRRLTVSDTNEYPGIEQPSYSPDGSKVLFERKTTDTGHGDIFELDLATGTEKRLTHLDYYVVLNLRYLPDGRNFIFEGWGPEGGDIVEYDALYAANQILILGPDRGYDHKPAFTQDSNSEIPSMSADGNKILFQAHTNENEIGVVKRYRPNVDLFVRSNGQNHRITDLKLRIEHSVLSPDGETIFFYADINRAPNWRPTSKKDKYVFWLINSDGTNMREIRFPDQPALTVE